MDAAEEATDGILSIAVLKEDSFSLSDTPLSDDDVEELCNYLSNGAFYFHLALRNTQLSLKGLEKICSLLKSTKQFKTVDLSENSFSTRCFSLIAKTVATSKVTTLVLDNTSFGNDAVTKFGVIAKSRTLSSLSLCDNCLDDEGFRHLSFFLQKCSRLSSLRLANNEMTAESYPILSDFLENTPNIKEIDLSGVEMTTRQSKPFRRLAELSQCSIILTTDALANSDRKECDEKSHDLCLALQAVGELYARATEATEPIFDALPISEEDDDVVKELLCYPSLLASSIGKVEEFLMQCDADISSLQQLFIHNMSGIITVLNAPFSLCLDHAPANPVHSNPCGFVRIQLVSLCATFMACGSAEARTAMVACGVPERVLELMMGFPWNSVLHTKCALFFIAGIENSDSEVLSHFFETMKLDAVIASAVEKKEDVGYLGAFMQIAESIEKCGKGAGKEWDAFCERVLYPLLQKKAAFEQLRH
ncbi:hypothetical protein AV274_3315 [Blastocystis sp. ATCC 50177/Nand II]|uniref:Uncharacterized protein n=1 Tax=Blastocystis sp. subtype 1 (strain ATCC 50177 / NandII) TaxID=478820 RepID=A0A196SD81_BLAHN|nr:hypothetical protein AV274_3315 [Blastocystis sp. ATCC 50177/Nand II]